MKKNLLFLNFFGSFLFLLFFGTSLVNATITSQPVSVTVCAGSTSIAFSIKTDLSLPTYQWQFLYNKVWTNLVDQPDPFSGMTIVGAKTSNITFGFNKTEPLTTKFSGMQVRCVVFFKLFADYSSVAVATVVAAPTFTSHPSNVDVIVDQSASFSITASGTGLSYQWQLDQGAGYADILNANSTSYNIKYVSAISDAGTYRCVVSNGVCSARYSSGALLTVSQILTIDKQPRKASTCAGSSAEFAVVASNATGYQWEVFPAIFGPWTTIPEATASTLTLNPVSVSMYNNQYRCVVTGGAGQSLTSFAGILYVYSNVAITTNPSGANKIAGESVTFNASASGSVQSYQWQFNNANISGANSPSYTIGSMQLSNIGEYSCIVTGACNTASTSAASLGVAVPAYPNGWYKQTSGSSQNLTSVSSISDLKAWALTVDNDHLLKTTDGGATWTDIYTGHLGYWKSIYFISESRGLIGGYNGVSITLNGGNSWSYIDLKTQFGLGISEYFYILNFHFWDANNGWAVGSNGVVIKTTDGGSSWTRFGYKIGLPKVTDVDLNSVYFTDSNTGYIGGVNGVLFKTTNGGANWTELTSPVTSSTINDLAFITASKGFLVTSSYSGSMYATTDGGATWTKVTIPGTNNLINSIDFVDANNGWAAGTYYDYNTSSYPALVLKTFDGGLSWVNQRIDNPSELYEIRMFSADHGWTVGRSGKIFRTGKGGCYDPIVSLYADQTLCANQSYNLVADTFANNYNSRYLWSTTSTAGHITVNSTSNYSVTITNECGKTASDNATITFLTLPVVNAGADVAICEGESAQLNASGGAAYQWTNAAYLNDNLIANPIATPPTELATSFTVTATDASGCSNSDAVIVTVNALPTSDFTAPAYVCGTAQGSFTYTGSADATKSYTWDFSGGTVVSGTNAGPLNVSWSELGDKLVSLTTTQNNCTSAPTLKIVSAREKPTADFNAPAAVCGSSSSVLIYSGSAPTDANYSWGIDGGTITSGTGQGPIQISWSTPGSKSLSLSVTQNSCVSDVVNNAVSVAYPYEGEQICLVTIDLETGKNMVVWEKTHNVGTASYNVYREGTIQNNYDLLGNVPFDQLSVFVDATSKPEQQQYKYKISAVDTCGNESTKSKWHKTMLLQFVSSVNGVNLNWQEYGVESGLMSFNSYAIFRGSDSTSLAELTTISASFLAYTDNTPDALSKKMYYRVGGVKATACDPAELGGKKASSGPFVHSLSNLEDNRLQSSGTGINNRLADAMNLSVYPSPFTDLATISYTLQKSSKMKVEIYNVVGEKMGEILNETQVAGTHKLEMKASDVNYVGGLYYLKISVDQNTIIKKTMLTR